MILTNEPIHWKNEYWDSFIKTVFLYLEKLSYILYISTLARIIRHSLWNNYDTSGFYNWNLDEHQLKRNLLVGCRIDCILYTLTYKCKKKGVTYFKKLNSNFPNKEKLLIWICEYSSILVVLILIQKHNILRYA